MKKNPCWSGYEMVGSKKKGGRTVPNCVPFKENLGFGGYVGRRDSDDARASLVEHLVQSGVDVQLFSEGLDIVQEWGWNPFKTFARSGATGAGAVAGSAFGPAGTVLGGMAGNALGAGANALAGKVLDGSRIKAVTPVYQAAVKAVDNLSKMLGSPDIASMPDAAQMKAGIDGFSQNLSGMGAGVASMDQERNRALDDKLSAGGGIGGKLRGATGDGMLAKGMRFLGDKIKNIPALNKDQGLRRAVSQGMDSVQQWANDNPKKAALLNVGAGVAGGLGGAMAAGSMMGNGQPAQGQGQQEPTKPISKPVDAPVANANASANATASANASASANANSTADIGGRYVNAGMGSDSGGSSRDHYVNADSSGARTDGGTKSNRFWGSHIGEPVAGLEEPVDTTGTLPRGRLHRGVKNPTV